MAILTKFLQLLKPEKNDYVDVEKHLSENYDKIDAELEKKASATQLGRIKIGTNLKIDPDGTLHGNPGYTHPTGNGNNHIPANGASGNFLKYLSAGVAQWAKMTKKDIDDFPSFGTEANEMLEGAKLAETLGIPYGGSLNNSNTKTEGTAYYDSTTKKTYKCTVTNTLNYADASKYEAISNNDLLLKFQNLDNLYKVKKIFSGKTQQAINLGDLTGITTLLIQVQANDFSRLYMLEVNSTTNLINDVIGSSFAINLELKENKIVWNYNYADNSHILSVYGIRA